MRIALFALIVAVAAPAVAQSPPPTLPPRGTDYVESDCSGGIAGMSEQVRVLADGRIIKAARNADSVLRARATPGEVAGIWRKLNLARFERRMIRDGLYPPDGITCSLIRQQNGRLHTVVIPQLVRNERAIADLRSVLEDLNVLGRRATGPRLRPAGIVASPQR